MALSSISKERLPGNGCATRWGRRIFNEGRPMTRVSAWPKHNPLGGGHSDATCSRCTLIVVGLVAFLLQKALMTDLDLAEYKLSLGEDHWPIS